VQILYQIRGDGQQELLSWIIRYLMQ